MTAKIAVSLPDHLVEEARAAVAEGRASSVSAYVAEALAEKSRRRTLTELLDEMDAELGSPGAAAVARAARVLDALDAR
jgi:Arc/MetJ-type ribon-helix-helix transcriptional regulator